jgi:hypothetical protein
MQAFALVSAACLTDICSERPKGARTGELVAHPAESSNTRSMVIRMRSTLRSVATTIVAVIGAVAKHAAFRLGFRH